MEAARATTTAHGSNEGAADPNLKYSTATVHDPFKVTRSWYQNPDYGIPERPFVPPITAPNVLGSNSEREIINSIPDFNESVHTNVEANKPRTDGEEMILPKDVIKTISMENESTSNTISTTTNVSQRVPSLLFEAMAPIRQVTYKSTDQNLKYYPCIVYKREQYIHNKLFRSSSHIRR